MVQVCHASNGKAVATRAADFWDFPDESAEKQPWGIHHEVPVPQPAQNCYRRAAAKDRRRHSDTLATQRGQKARPSAQRKRLGTNTESSLMRKRMPTPRNVATIQSSSCSTSDNEDDIDDASESDAFEGTSQKMVQIRVTDEATLEKFYTTRFIQMQQIPCKIVNKAWIKVVEPKKQARHPYNGGSLASTIGRTGDGELTKPSWWPLDGCRHREPDHIQKHERLKLLLHILRKLYNYSGQDGNSVTVDDLQQSTRECFPSSSKYEKARQHLDDIYTTRRLEERYLRGEIDATVFINVHMPDQEPKETAKQPKPKPRTKSKRARGLLSLQSVPRKRASVLSQQQSPTALTAPIEHMSLKLEPFTDFGHSGLPMKREQLSLQPEQRFQVPDQAPTAQSSFSGANVSWSPQKPFKAPVMSQTSYAPTTAFNPDLERPLGFIPLPQGGIQYSDSDLQRIKAFNQPPEKLAQNPVQDVNWISPPFSQTTPNQNIWSFSPSNSAPMQQLNSTHSLSNGLQTMTDGQIAFASPPVGQGAADTTFISAHKYFPHAMDYGMFGDPTPGPQHGLPGFGFVPREDGGFH
ncbi:hypothetical protein MMC13_005528 [Lambiella insularis]|nr:hypothetical protein [Lambiella insularis]